jgi:hypothetical protein
MNRPTGWKPLPIVLKIIWILLLIGAVSSIMGVFSAPKVGFTFLGFDLYGKWAANAMFFSSILLPVLLLIAMMRRFRWTWIYGVGMYVLVIVNGLMSIKTLDKTVEIFMQLLPDFYLELVPDIYSVVYNSAIAGVILGALIDVFFLVMFIIKRKYFMAAETLPPVQSPE